MCNIANYQHATAPTRAVLDKLLCDITYELAGNAARGNRCALAASVVYTLYSFCLFAIDSNLVDRDKQAE